MAGYGNPLSSTGELEATWVKIEQINRASSTIEFLFWCLTMSSHITYGITGYYSPFLLLSLPFPCPCRASNWIILVLFTSAFSAAFATRVENKKGSAINGISIGAWYYWDENGMYQLAGQFTRPGKCRWILLALYLHIVIV